LVIITNAMGSLVRTLNDHFKSELEPPDLRPSSNVDFSVAWITRPATDPSLKKTSTIFVHSISRQLSNHVKSCCQIASPRQVSESSEDYDIIAHELMNDDDQVIHIEIEGDLDDQDSLGTSHQEDFKNNKKSLNVLNHEEDDPATVQVTFNGIEFVCDSCVFATNSKESLDDHMGSDKHLSIQSQIGMSIIAIEWALHTGRKLRISAL
jgi:hypothetical protein